MNMLKLGQTEGPFDFLFNCDEAFWFTDLQYWDLFVTIDCMLPEEMTPLSSPIHVKSMKSKNKFEMEVNKDLQSDSHPDIAADQSVRALLFDFYSFNFHHMICNTQ